MVAALKNHPRVQPGRAAGRFPANEKESYEASGCRSTEIAGESPVIPQDRGRGKRRYRRCRRHTETVRHQWLECDSAIARYARRNLYRCPGRGGPGDDLLLQRADRSGNSGPEPGRPGGTATKVSSSGSVSNVGYIRGALSEEIVHANLFRSLLGISTSAGDPYQSFFIPSNAFQTLDAMIALLSALENAFIAAYMAAVQEFALLAAQGKPLTFSGTTYYPKDFAYYAKIASSILGVEAEHRALGRAISPTIIPANEVNFEQDNYVYTVYNGKSSAVVALTPFLSAGSGKTQYSLQTALNGAASVSLPTYHSVPLEYY